MVFMDNNILDGKLDVTKMIDDMIKTQTELNEKILAEAIEENDFLVGSPIVKAELEEAFKGMKVTYTPLIDENMVIMIKKAVLRPQLWEV